MAALERLFDEKIFETLITSDGKKADEETVAMLLGMFNARVHKLEEKYYVETSKYGKTPLGFPKGIRINSRDPNLSQEELVRDFNAVFF